MKTQITAVIALVTFINLLFASCSKVVNITLNEVAVDAPKRITGVVSKSGDDVTFDKKGGRYEPTFRRITGVTADGVRVAKSLKALDSVRVVDFAEDSVAPITIVAPNFHDYMSPWQTDKLVSVVTKLGATHKFWSDGRIDTLNGVILGLSDTRISLRIPFDSVAYVGVKRPDKVRTGLLIIALTALTIWGVSEMIGDIHLFDFDCSQN